MRAVIHLLAILTVFILPTFAPLRAQDRSAELQLARTRAQHLRHGINASNWFAQNPGHYSARYTDTEITPTDIALMARLGFDNVRISIDAVPLQQYPLGPDGLNADFLSRLDRAVDDFLSHGLAVQIDLHPEDDYKQRLRSDPYSVDRFIMLWRKLAAHYASRNPDLVFFEILNEPEVNDPYRWAGIQERAAAAIRQVAPHNTIIATGPNYSDIPDLLAMHPLADGNIIYTFHFYDPHVFTHQGASWSVPWWSLEHGIPYPPTADSMQPLLQEIPDLAYRYDLENYWLDHWDAQRVRALVDEAAEWGKLNNVPLLCNEFGAYREYTDPDSRNRWIHDVRTALEADGIGWDMWDFHGGFGVATREGGKSVPDPATVKALGLSRE